MRNLSTYSRLHATLLVACFLSLGVLSNSARAITASPTAQGQGSDDWNVSTIFTPSFQTYCYTATDLPEPGLALTSAMALIGLSLMKRYRRPAR